jgi:limonene-1,2-epoxide hydrolase
MIDLDRATNDDERLALALLRAMEQGRTGAAIVELCTEDFVWENSGLPTIRGIEGYRELVRSGGFTTWIPILATMRTFTVDLLNLASSGEPGNRVVFTERIDHFWDAEGRDLMTPHICGVIELRNGRIAAMREFYDVAVYQQTPTEPDPAHAVR